MKVFGPTPWGNWPDKVVVQTPVGESCQLCGELVLHGDLGVLMPFVGEVEEERPWHRDFLLYSILGKPEDKRGALRSSAAAARRRIDRETKSYRDASGFRVMHSAPTFLGVAKAHNDKSLCGIAVGTAGVSMTRCLPDEDALGHDQVGCSRCIDEFERTGGKALWRRDAT